ncbi:hypothetical protein NPIL_475861, partial [Nephila pilipes]
MSSSELITATDSCDSVESDSPTPVALRTRSTKAISQASFTEAACLGLCKICHASFGSHDQLRLHLTSHKPNKKRNLAIQAIDDSSTISCTTVATPQLKQIPITGLKRTLHPLLEDSTSPTDGNTLTLLQDPSPTSHEVRNLLNSLVDKTASSANPVSPEDSPSLPEPGISLIHNSKISPMASPAAYRMHVMEDSSPESNNTIQNKNQDSILLSVNLKMKKLPKILSPIMTPPSPKSPDILDLILTEPATLSDSSPEVSILSSSTQAPQGTSTSPLNNQESRITYFPPITPSISSQQKKPTPSSKSIHSQPQLTPDSASLTHPATTDQKIISYAEAAQKGLCKMCNTYVPPRSLLNHINLHRPCTKRHKCIKAAQKEPSCAFVKPKPQSKTISTIEEKFREKFPELPIFQNNSSSSS